MGWGIRTLGVAAWLCLASCSDEVVRIGHFHVPAAHASGADAGEPRDAAISSAPESGTAGSAAPVQVGDTPTLERGTRAEFCAGNGSVLRVGSGRCAPGIGRQLFRYALCTCGDVNIPQTLTTIDAFDSRQGAFAKGESGAAVGVNGALQVSTVALTVNGTGIVAGGGTLQIGSTFAFSADFKTNAAIEQVGLGIFNIGRDLWSDGSIHAGLTSSVRRDLYQTPGHSAADAFVNVGGSRHTRDFVVTPPCACGDAKALDIPKLVAAAQGADDNTAIALSPAALSGALQSGMMPAELTCGRFSMQSASLPSGVLQKIGGRLALFVDGDLTLQGDLASSLDPQAELDVFISGNLITPGASHIGVPARPSAVRLFIGGSMPITITDKVSFAAQIYAPHARVTVDNPSLGPDVFYIDTYGSIFAASVDVTTFFTLHYDRAIADLGERCDSAPAGACGACRTDADCCEPFGCTDGKCQPLVYTPPTN